MRIDERQRVLWRVDSLIGCYRNRAAVTYPLQGLRVFSRDGLLGKIDSCSGQCLQHTQSFFAVISLVCIDVERERGPYCCTNRMDAFDIKIGV